MPRRVGNVKLGEMLGRGGGGAVFAGTDEVLGRRVAVKLLHLQRGSSGDSATAELIDGVRAAASIKHPNIVTVYHVEAVAGLPVIVMEYIDGISLREMLKRSGPLELSLAVFVIRAVTSAVTALHEANILHRDIKPANILFDRGGEAHVCDFGLACEFDVTQFRGSTATIGGSPLYMAPEMFDGQLSPQSDVYALGIMLFELLSGRPPFSADTIGEIKALHVAAGVPIDQLTARGIDDSLLDIVRRSLNKRRFMRYKTAAHLLRALETVETRERREDMLRQRVAEIVTADQVDPGKTPDPSSATPAHTTFDLLSQRAAVKRRRRDETSPDER